MVAVLPKKVAAKYETTSGFNAVLYKGRKIDFRTITLEEAKLLAADESFPHLRKKVATARKKP